MYMFLNKIYYTYNIIAYFYSLSVRILQSGYFILKFSFLMVA